MSSEPITDSPDPRLQAALAEYLERIDRGEAVDREAFLVEFPDLAQELAPLLETADALEEIGGNSGESRPPDLSTHSQLSHDIETIAPGRQGQEATTSGPLPVEFGRYRTIKPLGQGAMGVVYLAEDTQLHRKVALKTSSFDNDQSGELLERFYREARSAATLRHPNICPVYDVGEIQGRHYISMAYIEGRTLASYVNANGSLHERQVLVLVRKLALALQDAHQHEIVHRDLKPANIMVDLKGEPIIMDFGLARIGYSEEESRLTQVGMIVGSPAYMSPEQVGGRPELLTGAADQYSLGVILFELLVGHPPFRGSVTAVVGQILTQPPPRLSSLRSDVSPAVEALCQKMLAKSPGERFASMKHVAEEIATLLRGSSTEKGAASQEDRGTPATSIPKTSLHAALVDEARQRLKQRDYPKAIEMLQQIPEAERPPEAAKLLAQALKLMDEVNFVLQEMEAALQSRDGATLAKRAQELVKLKPDHPRARQVRELIKKHGPERALQFLAENSAATPTSAPPRKLWIGSLAAGLAVLFAIIWFQFGDSRVKVEVLAEGYEVKFNEAEITITDGTRETKVKPGDHTLHIKSLNPGDGGTVEEFDTEKLTLKKGGLAVLTVTRENTEVVAKLDGQVIPRRAITGPARPDKQAVATTSVQTTSTATPDAHKEPISPVSPEGTARSVAAIPFPQDGRFTASRPLNEVNQGEPINAYPWITPDGLSLYWTRETQDVDSTVMQATRASMDAPFGDIKPVLRHARLASVSPDGLEIVCPFDVNGDGKPEELCTSRRATTSQEFPTPQAIPSLAGLHHALGSAFSEDGLKLIVLAAPQPNTTRIIHRVERSGTGAAWGTPRAVTIPNTHSEMDKITWPSLASGKHLIFSYQDPTNRPVEWGCVADATSDSLVFANPRHMLLDGERFIVRGGRYCPATGELFYTHSGTTPPFEKLEIRVARVEVAPATPPSNPEEGWTDLFNGRDLTGWIGLTGYWKWSNGELVGTLSAPLTQRNTVLRHDRTFRDFEIEYEMKLEGDQGGNSGLQVRSELMDPAIFLASGPQVDAGSVHWGGLSGELFGNTIMQAAKPAGTIKLNDYNKFHVRCVGKHITITLNGTVTVDGDFPEIADKGIIGWQLNGRVPSTVRLRNVRIRELNQPAMAAEPALGPGTPWTDLFNGRDLTGWTPMGHQGWRVENGVLIGETQNAEGWLMSSSEYDNFEFDFEYRLAAGTNSGIFLRAFPDGPLSGKEFLEVQVMDETDEAAQTMSASQRTGALYSTLEARPIPDLRPNLWHRMNIAVHNQDIRVSVNGQEVTRGKIQDGKAPRGHIGLQLSPRTQPQRCEFQKLRVRPLKDGFSAGPVMAQADAKVPPEGPVDPDTGKVSTPPIVQHGLKAEIFEGRNLEKKVGEQIEPNVECFWELGAPSKDAPIDNFSVRFTGWLRAPKTGRYKLILHSKDGARLKINHRTVIDNWKPKPADAEASLELTQEPQPIEVEVYNADLHSWVSLLWQPAGTATACHIPATALFPDLENAHSKAPRTSIDKTGLVAEYFDKTFRRRLATDHVYRIEELWGPHSPRWGLPTDSGARYSGVLVPPVSGQYKFVTAAREHIRVWIDDKPTVESKGISPPQSAVKDLEANKPYEIRVEILTSNHGAHYVHWIPPGTTKEVSIPPECLFPNKAAIRQASATPTAKPPATEKPAAVTISAAERETIERGLAQMKADDEAAGKKLLKAIDEQIEKVRAAPKLSADERVVRIKGLENEKDLFEKHGHIPFSLAVRTDTLKYLKEFTEARTDAAKVYDKLIETLTKQKKDELASLMRTERDIAVGPKVVATWRTTEINGGRMADWTIWSNGSVGKPDRQFLWMMDESRFRIQWRPDPQWIDTLVVGPDSMKANIYNAKREHTINGERVAP